MGESDVLFYLRGEINRRRNDVVGTREFGYSRALDDIWKWSESMISSAKNADAEVSRLGDLAEKQARKLDRQEKEISRLRAALEPFAVDLTFLGKVRDECRIDVNVPVSAVRAAHAALQTIRETNRGNAPQSPPSEGGEDESHL